MPLDKNNFEQFYLGNAAEHKIMSDLFFLSLESHKLNPDIGLDLLVTNKAICQFKNAKEIQHYLQIKSTFYINNCAKFYISENELKYLRDTDDVSTVFCYITPLIEETAKSFDRGDFEPWRESLDAEGEYHLYHNNFHEIKKDGCLSALDFKGFEMKYIWLNNKQLNTSFKDGYFKKLNKKNNSDQLYYLELASDEDNMLTIVNNNTTPIESETLISEVQNLYYLFNHSQTKDRLDGGDYLFSHY